jgi:hypothetical protein
MAYMEEIETAIGKNHPPPLLLQGPDPLDQAIRRKDLSH